MLPCETMGKCLQQSRGLDTEEQELTVIYMLDQDSKSGITKYKTNYKTKYNEVNVSILNL